MQTIKLLPLSIFLLKVFLDLALIWILFKLMQFVLCNTRKKIIWMVVNLILVIKKSFFFRALNQNEYNHITATYFLLAERKLRIQRIQNSHQLRGKNKKSPNNDEDELSSEATAASPSEVLSPLASPPLPPIQMTSSMPPPTYDFFFCYSVVIF